MRPLANVRGAWVSLSEQRWVRSAERYSHPSIGRKDPLQVGNKGLLRAAPKKARRKKKNNNLSNQQTAAIVACVVVAVILLMFAGWVFIASSGEADVKTRQIVAQTVPAPKSERSSGPPPPPTLKNAAPPAVTNKTPATSTPAPGKGIPPSAGSSTAAPQNFPIVPFESPFDSPAMGLPAQQATVPSTSAKAPADSADGASATEGRVPPQTSPIDAAAKVTEERPAPASGDNPFAQLPEEVELQFSGTLGEESHLALGSLTEDADASWQLEINSDAADLDAVEFQIGPCDAADGTVSWPIYLKLQETGDENKKSELLSTAIGENSPIAHLVASQRKFYVAYDANKAKRQIVHLRNCILTLSDGTHSHEMQLRKHEVVNPIALDTTQSNVTLDFAVRTPPSDQRIVMELDYPLGVPAGFSVEPVDSQVGINEQLCMKSTELPFVEIGIRLTKASDKYSVRVAPRYLMNGKKQPLILSAINTAINKMSRQFVENQNAISAANRRLGGIPSDMSRVQSTRPTSTGHAAQLGAAANGLIKESKKLQSRIRRLTEANPQLKQNVENLKKLAPFVNQIGNDLEIELRISARTASGEIILLKTN